LNIFEAFFRLGVAADFAVMRISFQDDGIN
jgi:hypothetical protein